MDEQISNFDNEDVLNCMLYKYSIYKDTDHKCSESENILFLPL